MRILTPVRVAAALTMPSDATVVVTGSVTLNG